MKLTLKNPKPRNPFAMAASRRAAGSHRPAAGAQRQQAKRALREDMARARSSP